MRQLSFSVAASLFGLVLAVPAMAQDPAAIGRGAAVYARTCSRCHNLRSPTERTDWQWGVISAHMRSRANLTKSDTRAVIAFLRATNGDDAGSSAGSASSPNVKPAANSRQSPAVRGPMRDLILTYQGRLNAAGHGTPPRIR